MERRVNIWTAVDKITILLFLVLVILGWLNIYAAVYNEEHRKIVDFSQRYGKQMVWIITTLLLALVVLNIDNRFFFFFGYIIYGIFILLLALVLVAGKEVYGTKAWFEFGPFTIQPSEFAKAGTALALAKFLNASEQELTKLKVLLPSAGIILFPALLTAIQPDFGTTIVYLSLFLVLFREGLSPYVFVSGILMIILFFIALLFNELYITLILLAAGFILAVPVTGKFIKVFRGFIILSLVTGGIYLLDYYYIKSLNLLAIIIIGLLISGLFYLWYIYWSKTKSMLVIYLFVLGSILYVNIVDYVYHHILKPHQRERIEILLRIKTDPKGAGYNINQSVISIGSGGLTGKGYLRGTQTKFRFVPAQSTDFIFCTVGEEWGFAGSTTVIGLYVFLFLRLVFLAERQRSAFSRIFGYS
ncbi:MAG: rod shape-determining protein RodA, partial [Bacteroidales bacterium]